MSVKFTELPDDAPQPDPGTFVPSFADQLPDDAGTMNNGSVVFDIVNEPAETEPSAPDPVERRKKRLRMSRKMRASMDKIRNVSGEALVMWFHDQAKANPEWELDKLEEDWLKDSMETVFEVLDIDLMIEPISITLTSIWWVIAYPFCTFFYLFFLKKAKVKQTEETDAT